MDLKQCFHDSGQLETEKSDQAVCIDSQAKKVVRVGIDHSEGITASEIANFMFSGMTREKAQMDRNNCVWCLAKEYRNRHLPYGKCNRKLYVLYKSNESGGVRL